MMRPVAMMPVAMMRSTAMMRLAADLGTARDNSASRAADEHGEDRRHLSRLLDVNVDYSGERRNDVSMERRP